LLPNSEVDIMRGRKDGQQAGPAQQQPAQQHVDDTLDRQVQEYSKLYSIDQWLQPRRWVVSGSLQEPVSTGRWLPGCARG
jgi:hypothetical protein